MPKASDILACPGPPGLRQSDRITKEYEISIVTPLFGGGAVAGEIDETLPIRASAIRGHLRHWWRTTIGHTLADGMWQREEEVFGSAEFPSPLDVTVLEQPTLRPVDPADPGYDGSFGPIAYALFSAIGNHRQVAEQGSRFRLRLTWDKPGTLANRRAGQNAQRQHERRPLLPPAIEDIEPDVTAACQTWLTLGGIGARTRRGCGAVFCANSLPRVTGVRAAIFVAAPTTTALDAWKTAVEVYRTFRQTPRGKRHLKTTPSGTVNRVPGRSHWPEPDSIRAITGCALRAPGGPTPGVPTDEDPKDHSTTLVPPSLLPAFPRAILGLPINFHFSDYPGRNLPGRRDRDPQDVQLLPAFSATSDPLDRMYSPVITRPLWINGAWRPAVIILQRQLPTNLRFRLVGEQASIGGAYLSRDIGPERVIDPSLGAIGPMRGCASALDALRTFLLSNGFTVK